jgi:nitrate reductase gamma subunit
LDRLTLFWILHLVFLGAFVLECMVVLSIWLRGRVPGLPPDASTLRKLRQIVKISISTVFSRRLLGLVRAIIVDGMVHPKLLQTSRPRWLAHVAVFGSFFVLGIISIITGVMEEILYHLLQVDHPLVLAFVDRDNPVLAFLNEFLGVVFLLGLLYVGYRRFIRKDPQLRTIGSDRVTLILLLLIAITGFPVESFRLLHTRPYAPTAYFGFMGWGLANLLEPLNWPWEELHYICFFIHFLVTSALLFYLPFSKFLHILVSPILVVIDAASREAPDEP